MRNLVLIPLILGSSLLAAQQQNNVFNKNDQTNIFDEEEKQQEEVITSQRGPGTDTPDDDLEDEEPVPIDKNTGWLFIAAIVMIIFYTFKRKKTVVK